MWRILPAFRPVGVVLTGCRAVVSDASRSVPPVPWILASGAAVVVTWVVLVCLALLVLRTVCLEELDREQDDRDDEVSGHVPSE